MSRRGRRRHCRRGRLRYDNESAVRKQKKMRFARRIVNIILFSNRSSVGVTQHIPRLGAFVADDEVELHFLSLVQGPESFARYRGIVNKNVFSILCRNESVSLLGIKPFHYTVSHLLLLDDYWSDGITVM
jgi:hypothetical protein